MTNTKSSKVSGSSVDIHAIWVGMGSIDRFRPQAYGYTSRCRVLLRDGWISINVIKGLGLASEGVAADYECWLKAGLACEAERAAEAARGRDAEAAVVVGSSPARLLRDAYRAMSLKHHPDHGGDVKSQVVITEFYEMLKSAFESL